MSARIEAPFITEPTSRISRTEHPGSHQSPGKHRSVSVPFQVMCETISCVSSVWKRQGEASSTPINKVSQG